MQKLEIKKNMASSGGGRRGGTRGRQLNYKKLYVFVLFFRQKCRQLEKDERHHKCDVAATSFSL